MEDENLDLTQGSILKLLLRFSIPAISGMVINAIYAFVDKIFVSRTAGALAFSGIVVSMPLILIAMGFALLVGVGAAVQISIRMGEGRRHIAERTLGNAIILFIAVSAVITTIGLVFLEPLLTLYGARGEVLDYAMQYMRIIIIGSSFQIIGFGLTHLIRAIGKPYQSMFAMVVGAVLNIFLSFIFVFLFNLGVRGAAISTVIAQSVTLMLALYILIRGKNMPVRLKARNLKLNWKMVFGIFAFGMSPFFTQIVGSVVVGITNNTLRVYGGELAIGAMGIIAQFVMLFLMPIFGLNQGSQPILGFNYGAKRYDRVKATLKYTVSTAAAISFIGWFVIVFFPQIPIRIFTEDQALIDIAMSGMPIFAGAFLLTGTQLIMAMFFQSVGKAKIALILNMLRQVILFIPLMLILPRYLGLYGVWYAGLIADITAFVITVSLFTYTLRTKLRSIVRVKLRT